MSGKGRLRRFAIGCLAVVGAVDLLARGAVLLHSYRRSLRPPADVMTAALLSPDGKFKVVQFSENGGGGFAPYCSFTIAIVPGDVPDKAAWSDENTVSEIPCLGLRTGGVGHGIAWENERRLKIVVDVSGALQHGSLSLKPQDATGHVLIDYATQ